MILLKPFLNFNTYLTLLLATTAILGDLIVNHTNLHLFQALFDNCTHAIIGGLTWLIVVLNTKYGGSRSALLEVVLCCFLSSVIDVDHFVAAKSLHLKDVSLLKQRPFLHCSSVPLLIVLVLLLTSYVLEVPWLKSLALILLAAFFTHHTRDATRRGYWFYPFGSTPAIPYSIYIILTCFAPYLVLFIDHVIKVQSNKVVFEKTSQYSLI